MTTAIKNHLTLMFVRPSPETNRMFYKIVEGWLEAPLEHIHDHCKHDYFGLANSMKTAYLIMAGRGGPNWITLAALDAPGRLQGVALFEYDAKTARTDLHRLIKSPGYVERASNSPPNASFSQKVIYPAKGVGTSLVYALAKKTLENCRASSPKLVLEPMESSTPYFEKLGFTYTKEMPKCYDTEYVMELNLTAEKVDAMRRKIEDYGVRLTFD